MNVATYEQYRANQTTDHDEFVKWWFRDDLLHRGENRFGVEFKYDHRFRDTGNFYIETHEKARPREGDYVPSGIYRADTTWLWAQGDMKSLWVFSKETLTECCERSHLAKRQSPTSIGFLLPIDMADHVAIRRLGPAYHIDPEAA